MKVRSDLFFYKVIDHFDLEYFIKKVVAHPFRITTFKISFSKDERLWAKGDIALYKLFDEIFYVEMAITPSKMVR
jgi:hypothetical protein